MNANSLKTGWPTPALAQDDSRKLFAWFASKLDSRQRVREACADTQREAGMAEAFLQWHVTGCFTAAADYHRARREWENALMGQEAHGA